MTTTKATGDLKVAARTWIPVQELRWQFTRSSGPGGQHVNTTQTKAVLQWDLSMTHALTHSQKQLVEHELKRYINKHGVLIVSSDQYRDQLRNKQAVLYRLQHLVSQALIVPERRLPTKPRRGAIERRLRDKKKLQDKKKERRSSKSWKKDLG